MMATMLVLSSGASAAEVAFYPFSEGNDGASAIGVALHNAVDASALGGSAVRNNGDTATATFLYDVPGRYLYTNNVWRADAVYSTNVFRSIQTSWETNWNAQITSATSIEFADLGARLAALDSWTVEFFFKFDVVRMTNKGAYQTYQYNVRFGEGERIFTLLQSQPDSAGRGYSVRAIYASTAGNASIARLDKGDGIVPGMWHHMAVTYNGETRKLKYRLFPANASNKNAYWFCGNMPTFNPIGLDQVLTVPATTPTGRFLVYECRNAEREVIGHLRVDVVAKGQ
jgi:hypothetical protein